MEYIKYIFNTTATMKPYNNKKYWVDPCIIPKIEIIASNTKKTIKKYKNIINNKYCVNISDNALKNKAAMYIDIEDGTSKQVGYIITGKIDCEDYNSKLVTKYIDLWVEILTVIDTKF